MRALGKYHGRGKESLRFVRDCAHGQSTTRSYEYGANCVADTSVTGRIPPPLLLFPLCCQQTNTKKAVIIGFDEAYPLWALSSSDAGGLEWSSMQIGQVNIAADLGNE